MTLLEISPIIMLLLLLSGMTYAVMKLNRWKALPILADVLFIPCDGCGSDQLKEQPLWGKSSKEHIFLCANCKTPRYRNQPFKLDD